MLQYALEFVLSAVCVPQEKIVMTIRDFGQDLKIVELSQEAPVEKKDYQINIATDDPTIIFDLCSQFGRIKAVKVEEAKGGLKWQRQS